MDYTLMDYDGKLIEDVGWFWDHADQHHLIAHHDLDPNDVRINGKHVLLVLQKRELHRRDERQHTGMGDCQLRTAGGGIAVSATFS